MFRIRLSLLAVGLCMAGPLLAQRPQPSAWDRADSTTVRLPPSLFAILPKPIREALTDRGCRIPQSPGVPGLHNIAKGHLRNSHSVDWVALCSIDRVSRILVFWAGDTTRVDSFPPQADKAFLQGMGGSSIMFSHVIGIADPEDIRQEAAAFNGPLPPGTLHDGIEDAFAEKGSTILYWSAGRWIALDGAD